MRRFILLLAVLLAVCGCSDASRNLTVTVEDGGWLWIDESVISPEVLKEGNTESPTQSTAPEVSLPELSL